MILWTILQTTHMRSCFILNNIKHNNYFFVISFVQLSAGRKNIDRIGIINTVVLPIIHFLSRDDINILEYCN